MRTAEIKRKTKETDISLKLTLEGGERKIDTGIEEPLCGLDRVFCYFMCSAVVAFLQAHALTVFQINCGDNSHFPTSVSFAKLRSIASPTSPLFSG